MYVCTHTHLAAGAPSLDVLTRDPPRLELNSAEQLRLARLKRGEAGEIEVVRRAV